MSSAARKAVVVFVLLAGVAYFLIARDEVAPGGYTYRDLGTGATVEARDGGRENDAAPALDGTHALDATRALDAFADPALAAPQPDAEPARALRITGRVVDFAGVPIAGVPIVQRHPFLEAGPLASDTDGTFSLLVEQARGELEARSDAWILLGGERLLTDDKKDGYLLVLAPRATWTGVVRNGRGEPLGDALITVRAPGNALVRFGLSNTPLEHESQRAWSDLQGAFRVGPAPDIAGTTLEVTLAGYATTTVELGGDPSMPLAIVLVHR